VERRADASERNTEARVTSFVLVLVLLATTEDDFYRAVALAKEGQPAAAARAMRRVADGDDAFADDALAELARVDEEQLADPVAALAAWEELVRRFPQSRLAVKAEKRAGALREALGPGGAAAPAVAEWQKILNAFGSVPHAESLARAEALLAAHPDFGGAPQVAYWIGTVLEQDGDPAAALARWREVATRWPTSEWAARAQRRIGDILLGRGAIDGAEAAYRAAGSADGLARIARERFRERLAAGAWALLVLLAVGAAVEARRLAGSTRGAAALLARPPAEALYLLPVAAIIVGAGLTENWAIGHALVFICAGGLVVAWLSGALLEGARSRGPVGWRRVATHVLAATLAIAAICYISVTRERLADMLVETIRFGPD